MEGVIGADPDKERCMVYPAFSGVPGSDFAVEYSNKYNCSDHGPEK